MDTVDRSNSNLPARYTSDPSLIPSLPSTVSIESPAASPSQISSRTLFRGLKRRWWQILLVWLVPSGLIDYSIYRFIKPTYEAFCLLRVEPNAPDLFRSAQPGGLAEYRGVAPYLNTQASLILSDQVLNAAIASPPVVNLATIIASEDARTDLRNNLVVEIVAEAFLIRIALELEDGDEAAAIVNAVASSYIRYNTDHTRGKNKGLMADLQHKYEVYKTEIAEKKTNLRTLYEKGTVDAPKAKLNIPKDGDDVAQPTFSQVTDEQVQTMVNEMVRTDFELVEARANLKAMEDRIKTAEESNLRESQLSDSQLEKKVREEFFKDPEVIPLEREMQETQEMLDGIKAKARMANDPSRAAAEKHLQTLKDDWQDLWKEKHKEIRERLTAGALGAQPTAVLDDLRMKVQVLKAKHDKQVELFENLKVEKKTVNTDTFEATYLSQEINGLQNKQNKLKETLEQLEFESERETLRVVQVDPAVAPNTPTNSKHIKYMLAAPVGILFMVVGLFLLVEIKAERVADPDSLSLCVRSQVYPLPPLLTPREARRLSAPKADEQVEQFIQRLEHLRFAVCSTPDLGKGRCVLITSAIGGEGKTTLAAQLALRCGNAGMDTLLIDADFRRTSLCKVLDVPGGPGLSDVLMEKAAADDVIIPVQGGTYYLLRAGAEIEDTSRVLQSRSVELLIGELRRRYDLIIIDSPPVLPVPDALMLGRWADGAVLAVKYDNSRFSQVERARRQLHNAGIAILGTVINGMRNTDSYYGRYSYARQQSSPSNSADTI
jgi:capsular exopolysaccharide synthesis family protein